MNLFIYSLNFTQLHIYRLDTTSTKWSDICAPEYGEHPEAGKEMNLNLRRFEDGCV